MNLSRKDILLIVVITAIVAASVVYVVSESHGADVTVYTDDGVHASVSGDIYGNTILTATTDSGSEFRGWFDEKGNLLSTDRRATLFLNDGTRIFAYSSGYVILEPGAYDLTTILKVDSEGSFTLTTSEPDVDTPELKGSSVELTSLGVYDVTYTDGDTHRCWKILVDGEKECTFEWKYSTSDIPIFNFFRRQLGSDYKIVLDIQFSDYVHYRDLYLNDRASHYLNKGSSEKDIRHDLSYVNYDQVQEKYVKQIADYIDSITSGASQQYTANVILAFTQYIPYEYDMTVHGKDEYWQFPLETLFLGSGDCEDTSILFCTIAEYMGYNTCLFYFDGHMGTGVNLDSFTPPGRTSDSIEKDKSGWRLETGTDEKGEPIKTAFYYGETTTTSWLIGEIPHREYDLFEKGFPLSVYGGRPVTLNVVTTDGVTYAATSEGNGYTTVTANVPEGVLFHGWYDAEGALLSESTMFKTKLNEGATLYAVAGSCINADRPVKVGETVNINTVAGVSGTLNVLGDGVTRNGDSVTFGHSGSYLVTRSDDPSWVGIVYAYPDVTVYTGTGLHATVSGEDLCTVITVSVDDGYGLRGIFTREFLLSEDTVYRGPVADGEVVFILPQNHANTDSIIVGDVVDLSTVTGVTGTWGAMDEYFQPVSGLEGGFLTVNRLGTYVITCDTGTTNWCGLIHTDRTGLYQEFDVTGWFLQETFFGIRTKAPISGTLEFDYVYYSEIRDSYYMRQSYSWSNGNSGTSSYWSGDSEYEDYTETYGGVSEMAVKGYGTVSASLWTLRYTNEEGYQVTERQFTDADKGYPLYRIEADFAYNGTVYRHFEYELADFGFRTPVKEELDLRAYADKGITITCNDPREFGDELTLTAVVEEGYTFYGWYDENMNPVSDSMTYDGPAIYADGLVTIIAKTGGTETILADGEVDLDTLLGVDGSGTWNVYTEYMTAPTDVTVSGNKAVFETLGAHYNVFYTDTANGVYRWCTVFVDGHTPVTYDWVYDGTDYHAELDILYTDYEHYLNACSLYERSSQYNGTEYDTEHDKSFVRFDDVQDRYMEALANQIRTQTEGRSQQYVADVIKCFCSAGDTGGFTYVNDIVTHRIDEYWQFPLETLYLKTGDCEDTAFLFAALAKYMDYDVCLFRFQDHMAAGVILDTFTPSGNSGTSISETYHYISINEKEYYYVETTNSTWAVGDVWAQEYPDKYLVGTTV